MGLIRFTLALSVAVWHIPQPGFRLFNASIAVVGFFMISGFYMAMVLNEKYRSGAGTFYFARLTRLYPAYIVMVAVMVAWFWITHTPNVFTSRVPLTITEQCALIGANLFVVGQDLFELMNHTPGDSVRQWVSPDFFNTRWMLVGQAWSLSTEACFYLLAPFVVRSPLRIAALLAVSLTVRVYLLEFGDYTWAWGYWFFPGSVTFFLLGSVAYHMHKRTSNYLQARSKPIGLAILAAIGIWFFYTSIVDGIILASPPNGSIDQPRHWLAYVLFAVAIPFIFEATKDLTWDRAIGELSYPLYLVHSLVQGILYFVLHLPRGVVVYMVFALLASVMAAWLIWFLIDRPIEGWRQRRVLIATQG